MTRDDDPDRLPQFIHRVRDHVEDIHAARVPDFAAMIARARELDPDAVSAASAAEAEALAPVIPIQLGLRDRGDDAVLAPFTAATRAELELRRRRPVAPPPAPRRRLAAVIAVAAAAALLLALQAPQRLAHLLAHAPAGVEALDGNDTAPQQHAATPRPQPSTPTRTDPPTQTLDPPTQSPPSTPTQTLDPPTQGPPIDALEVTAPAPRPRRKSPAPDPSTPAPVTPLEDEAQALWQRGELAAAEAKFREVVKLAGRSPRAELAYGDLFALAGQIRGPAGQAALAREYLAAFPDGRFADDMRAGLCQRAAADARPACWRDYLEHHPTGAHRRAAETAAP